MGRILSALGVLLAVLGSLGTLAGGLLLHSPAVTGFACVTGVVGVVLIPVGWGMGKLQSDEHQR